MIDRVRIRNFKAIQEAEIRFSAITTFIGNNGSGKSSVIEALQTLQNCFLFSLSEAFNTRWLGLDNVKNAFSKGPIEFEIEGTYGDLRLEYIIAFDVNELNDYYFVAYEQLSENGELQYELKSSNQTSWADITRNDGSEPSLIENHRPIAILDGFVSGLGRIYLKQFIQRWQFLSLEPEKMYLPTPKEYSHKGWGINPSGENLADYFNPNNTSIFYSTIVEKLQYVLPDLSYIGKDGIEISKLVYLYLAENQHDKRIPSWLFSSGTLRILTLLTLLNSEVVPPVLFIEEVENGLDPRTLNMLVDEMARLIPSHQFVLTTHSPYLLDLLDLQHIVVAERLDGVTTYTRPDEDEKLQAWKEKFSPGRLYTMNKLTKR